GLVASGAPELPRGDRPGAGRALVRSAGGGRMTAAHETELDIRMVNVTHLMESPWNPRKHFNQAALEELAGSLKSKGQITPIVARPKGGRFEIAAGHRRFRALKLAGLSDALVLVV